MSERGEHAGRIMRDEAISLFENAAHLGLPVPDKLREILSQLHNRQDK